MTNGKFDVHVVILTQGTIKAELCSAMFQFLMEYTNEYNIIFGTSQRLIVDNNRNHIAKRFIEKDWDYLLMIDEDNPPTKNPLELLKLNLDVVILPTPSIKKQDNPPISFSVFDKVEKGYQAAVYKGGDKLIEVDAGGTGCILIKRSVLEAVKAPFESSWDEDGIRTLGSDIKFCEKAKQAGFKIWCHWDYICSHYKTVDLLDIIKLIKK